MDTLSKFYSPIYNRELDAMKQIVSCNGGQEGIFNVLSTFMTTGDEVLCIEPYFDAYKKAADMVGVKTVGVPLRFNSQSTKISSMFELDLDELESKITANTKLLVLNTPHNPTGKVFSRKELESIADVVRRHPQLMVLSDEVYE